MKGFFCHPFLEAKTLETRQRNPVLWLVFAIVLFDHPGTTKELELAGIGSLALPRDALLPTTVMVAELFKIESGQIQAIEAVLNWFPFGMKSGWG